MEALWFTDTHFNRKPNFIIKRFFELIEDDPRKHVILTGDISTGTELYKNLSTMAAVCKSKTIYFVLGNHDYHNMSFNTINSEVYSLVKKTKNLCWLSAEDNVLLNNKTALVGSEGWYDGSIGDPSFLNFTLDWLKIRELAQLQNSSERLNMYRDLAQNSANDIIGKCSNLSSEIKNVIIATHFPPFRGLSFKGIVSTFWLPYNQNISLANKLINHSDKTKNYTVLSGHIHTSENIKVSDNINAIIGDSCGCIKIRKENIITIY